MSKTRLAALALVSSALACGSSPPKPVAPPPAQPSPPPKEAVDPVPPLPAHVVAQLEDENATPYFARRGETGVLVLRARGRWKSQPIGADGAPAGGPIDLAPAAANVPLAAIRPVRDGY